MIQMWECGSVVQVYKALKGGATNAAQRRHYEMKHEWRQVGACRPATLIGRFTPTTPPLRRAREVWSYLGDTATNHFPSPVVMRASYPRIRITNGDQRRDERSTDRERERHRRRDEP